MATNNPTGFPILDEDDMASDSNTSLSTQQAIKAFIDSKSGNSIGLSSNMLFNSTFVISQLNSTFTAASPVANNDATYLVDGWVNLSDGNDIIDVRQDLTGIAASWGGNRYQCEIATANKQFGAVQFVESLTPESPIFESEDFTAIIAANLPGTAVTIDSIRFAIIEWTGTANSMTRDPITTWATGATLPTLAANWSYVENHSQITLDGTTRIYSITGTTSASATNIALIWWCSDGDATVGDQLAIRGAWLFPGDLTNSIPADATSVSALSDNFLPPVKVNEELQAAQRYFQKTFPQGTAVQQNSGTSLGAIGYRATNAGAVNTGGIYSYSATMRTAPTVTGYNPAAANANWRNFTDAADSASFSAEQIGDSGMLWFNNQVGGDGVGERIQVHVTLDARL